MLDIKRILAQPDAFRKAMHERNCKVDIEQLFVLDGQRREIIAQVEALKSKRNAESAQIARLKREKQDASELIAQMGAVGEEIKQLDEKLAAAEEQLRSVLMMIPNMAHESVPVGKDDAGKCLRSQMGRAARVSLRAQGALGYRQRSGHFRCEYGGKGNRLALYVL